MIRCIKEKRTREKAIKEIGKKVKEETKEEEKRKLLSFCSM